MGNPFGRPLVNSQPATYFLTLNVQDGRFLFGSVRKGKMTLSKAGQMVEAEWLKLAVRYPGIRLHEFVVMPNHFHGILEIQKTMKVAQLQDGEKFSSPNLNGTPSDSQGKAITLGDIMGAFRSITTVEYIRGVKTDHWPGFRLRLWQRGYWERIIHTEESLRIISRYIRMNPEKWGDDRLHKQIRRDAMGGIYTRHP